MVSGWISDRLTSAPRTSAGAPANRSNWPRARASMLMPSVIVANVLTSTAHWKVRAKSEMQRWLIRPGQVSTRMVALYSGGCPSGIALFHGLIGQRTGCRGSGSRPMR